MVSARVAMAAKHGKLVVLGCNDSECSRLEVGWSKQTGALEFRTATGCGWPEWRDCRDLARPVSTATLETPCLLKIQELLERTFL